MVSEVVNGGERDIVQEGRLKYERFLDDDMWKLYESLDEGEQAYFWAYLNEVMPRMLADSLAKELERRVIVGEKIREKLGLKSMDETVGKPFEHAESKLRAGSWFTRPAI